MDDAPDGRPRRHRRARLPTRLPAANSSAAAVRWRIRRRCTANRSPTAKGQSLIRSLPYAIPSSSARTKPCAAHLVTGAAETHDAALALVEKYHDRYLADRVFELAWTHSQVVLRQLDASEADTQLYGRLASNILYANPLLRQPAASLRNRRGQSGLWGYGISGDLPIVLLRIGDQTQINLVRQLVQAHAYWRVHGLAVDLVIWNEDQSGYRQMLNDQIVGVITSRSEGNLLDKPGGIFIRRLEQIPDEDKVLMQTVARVIVSDTAGTLAEQMDRHAGLEVAVPKFRPIRSRRAEIPLAVEMPTHDLAAFNGSGGFTHDGREYVVTTTPESPTPAPWVNVLANPWFGSVVSESGERVHLVRKRALVPPDTVEQRRRRRRHRRGLLRSR